MISKSKKRTQRRNNPLDKETQMPQMPVQVKDQMALTREKEVKYHHIGLTSSAEEISKW